MGDDERNIDATTATLAIRADRDGSIEVTYDGWPLPVSSIDIDDVTLNRLSAKPRTLRDQ